MSDEHRILIIDSFEADLNQTETLLNKTGYQVVTACCAAGLFENIEEFNPDLLLMEMLLPDMDGAQACAKIRENPRLKSIPVFMLSREGSPDMVIKGLESGAIDYITKPYNPRELLARIHNHLRIKGFQDKAINYSHDMEAANLALKKSNETIKRQNQKQAILLKELNKSAKTDYLTGLYNRRQMGENIDVAIHRYRKTGVSFGLMLADIDHFKLINDKFGHDMGDVVLIGISKIFRNNIRREDSVARWGGEEFLFLIPNITLDNLKARAEQIRSAVEKAEIKAGVASIRLTVTIGIYLYNDPMLSQRELVRKTDYALYKGKRNGRNQVASGS